MKVEFEFNKKKILDMGYTYEQVAATMQGICFERNLRYYSDGSTLIFFDNNHKDDYSSLWSIITHLINSDWFLKSASAIRWFDEDDDVEYEDVLSQAYKLLY